MKILIDTLRHNGILCKELTGIPPRTLGSRKVLDLYLGIDLKGYYCSLMVIPGRKSRLLTKEAQTLMALHQRLETHADTVIPGKYIWVKAPLCSKAKTFMESEGWIFLEE